MRNITNIVDAYECPDPVGCTRISHHHCSNAGCGNEDQQLEPPGYSPYCASCYPGNFIDREDVFVLSGLTLTDIRRIRDRLKEEGQRNS